MNIEELLTEKIREAIITLYNSDIDRKQIQLQKTNKDFEGDLTLVTFPLLKISRKNPEETAKDLGEYLLKNTSDIISKYNVIKAFLNLTIADNYFLDFLETIKNNDAFGLKTNNGEAPVIVEYSSPNTNKPLHLGHIRNNLLGWSVCELLKANGNNVKKVNLVNDRGIHICKSMIAWQLHGNGETPENTGMKGDKLVGKYYVYYDKIYKEQVKELEEKGLNTDEAQSNAPILLAAQEMLRKWEAGDKTTRELWQMMNNWVYQGFDVTYKRLGIDFDKIYYESDTYLLGKSMVLEGLQKGCLIKKENGSIWANLEKDGLDEKLLLRADGTSVYMTQDLGTTNLRYNDFLPEKMIYVVGNEQNYHFDVLKLILKKMNYAWWESITHLSYGMVELPEGKMKSREGTVVDADDLIDEMENTACIMTNELGKIDMFNDDEAEKLYHSIAMGALKYFILKVDPQKNMMFNPKNSIDFNGNTGPFIQYTHARICSLLLKSGLSDKIKTIKIPAIIINEKEKAVLSRLHDYPQIIEQAGNALSPAIVANYVYELAKDFNAFYQDTPVLKESNENIKLFRLLLCHAAGKTIKSALGLLGIEAPQKM